MSIKQLCNHVAALVLAAITTIGSASAAPIATADLLITDDDLPDSVRYLAFTVTTPGDYSIRALGSTTLGATFNFDPAAYLFFDDGTLDASDLIVGDNNPAVVDVFLNATLAAGNYLVAVSEFSLLLSEAVSGINGGNSVQDPNKLIRVIVESAATVPEPSTIALLALGFAVTTIRRRTRSRFVADGTR